MEPLNLSTAANNLRALEASKSSKEKDTSSKEKDTKSSKSKSSEGGGTNAPTATPKSPEPIDDGGEEISSISMGGDESMSMSASMSMNGDESMSTSASMSMDNSMSMSGSMPKVTGKT